MGRPSGQSLTRRGSAPHAVPPEDSGHSSGAALYRRCRLGDELAWAEVYSLALSIARRRGRGIQDEMTDIAADVVEKLLQPGELDRINDPAAFRGYIATITVRKVLDKLRSPGQRRRVWAQAEWEEGEDPVFDQPDGDPLPLSVVADRQAWAIVEAALARLAPACREVLIAYIEHILLDPEGSYKSLERALKAKRGTISSRVTRCLDEILKDPRVCSALGIPVNCAKA